MRILGLFIGLLRSSQRRRVGVGVVHTPTEKQQQALALVASGLSYRQAGKVLGITASSVGTRISNGGRKRDSIRAPRAAHDAEHLVNTLHRYVKNGYTPYALEPLLGVSATSIREWLRGQKLPNEHSARQLRRFFGSTR